MLTRPRSSHRTGNGGSGECEGQGSRRSPLRSPEAYGGWLRRSSRPAGFDRACILDGRRPTETPVSIPAQLDGRRSAQCLNSVIGLATFRRWAPTMLTGPSHFPLDGRSTLEPVRQLAGRTKPAHLALQVAHHRVGGVLLGSQGEVPFLGKVHAQLVVPEGDACSTLELGVQGLERLDSSARPVSALLRCAHVRVRLAPAPPAFALGVGVLQPPRPEVVRRPRLQPGDRVANLLTAALRVASPVSRLPGSSRFALLGR